MAEIRSPLVASSDVQLVSRYGTAQLIEDWQATFGIDISKDFQGVDELKLYRCAASQLDFFLPSIVFGSEDLYKELQRFEWYYMKDKWEFNEAIKDLEGSNKILEIGSGAGHFLERVINQLKGTSITGTEPNREAFEKASQKGLPVENTDVESLVNRGCIFQAVCSFQVLEHIHTPYEFLNALVKLLMSGGKLIVSVPNKDSFLKYQYNLLDMPPHHMTRWNAKTLQFLERLFPLKLKRLSFEPLAPYHIRGYLAAYADYWRRRLPILSPFFAQNAVNIYNRAFEKGLHRFFRGQTVYALLEKI